VVVRDTEVGVGVDVVAVVVSGVNPANAKEYIYFLTTGCIKIKRPTRVRECVSVIVIVKQFVTRTKSMHKNIESEAMCRV